jgi:hypothetical protein
MVCIIWLSWTDTWLPELLVSIRAAEIAVVFVRNVFPFMVDRLTYDDRTKGFSVLFPVMFMLNGPFPDAAPTT